MHSKNGFVLGLKSLGVGRGLSPVSHCGEMEACSAGLDLGFRMTSLAAAWREREARGGGRGFWEDSDGITWAGEARLENHRGMEEKQRVATVSVNLIKALTFLVPDREV